MKIQLNKPNESDWKDMSDEYGWSDDTFKWSSPIGDYVVGTYYKNDNIKWWYSPNKLYSYPVKGRIFDTKEEACDAAFNDFVKKINV